MKKKNWVNYKEIKELVSIQMILERYNVFDTLRKSGRNYVGKCPIHNGNNDRQFSVNLERNIWKCFGDCQTGGNVIDFVAKMESISIHQAGLLIKDWFHISSDGESKENHKIANKPSEKNKTPKLDKEETHINEPLTFHLKLEKKDSFLQERNISPKTIEYFGIGLAKRGMMKDRIAIPLHNEKGQLIAYCGRSRTKEMTEEKGKYKLPANFKKKDVIFNYHRLDKNLNYLIIVESFLSVFKIHQAGYPNVISLLGSELSSFQEKLITEFIKPGMLIYLMFDNDNSGIKCTNNCLIKLGKKSFIKAIDFYSSANKPHQLSVDQINKILNI